jgi:hypothetical protein
MEPTIQRIATDTEFPSATAHRGYAAERAKLDEIQSRREVAADEFERANAKLAEYRKSSIDDFARDVLAGGALEGPAASLAGDIQTLQNRLDILNRAAGMQLEILQQQHVAASMEMIGKLKPKYAPIERAFYLAMIEVGKQIEASQQFRVKLNGCGLQWDCGQANIFQEIPLLSILGLPTDCGGQIGRLLRQGLERGAIRRGDIPTHWEWIRAGI